MTFLEKRLQTQSGAPSQGVVTHSELGQLDETQLREAMSLVEQEIHRLVPGKTGSRDLASPNFRRRVAQLAMNRRLLEEELNSRPAAAAG